MINQILLVVITSSAYNLCCDKGHKESVRMTKKGIRLCSFNMLFLKKSHKTHALLLVTIGIILLSIVTTADAAKSKRSKQKSFSEGSRKNSVHGSLEAEESTTVHLPSTTKKTGKGKASYRGSRSQFFSKSKLTGAHGQHSWLAVANAVAAEKNHQLPMNDDSKPTKYHYYPHNQHLYLLPECATQQVCSAVYLRLNYSQPLCACPNFQRPCSVSTRTDDGHTIPLVTGPKSSNQQVLTLVKTCEPTHEVRECRAPKDWSILALQNSRTGKAHYLVICRCPSSGYLEGPIAHSQPAYARVPGIRVYGMTCVRPNNRRGRDFAWDLSSKNAKDDPSRGVNPAFPWHRLKPLLEEAGITSS